VLSSSQAFSKIYSNFYGNKKYSDFTITIGDETINSHKIVLSQNSDFFDKLEGK
jgi:hypothetical protein